MIKAYYIPGSGEIESTIQTTEDMSNNSKNNFQF